MIQIFNILCFAVGPVPNIATIKRTNEPSGSIAKPNGQPAWIVGPSGRRLAGELGVHRAQERVHLTAGALEREAADPFDILTNQTKNILTNQTKKE